MRRQYPQFFNKASLSKPSATENTTDSDSDDDNDSIDTEQPVLPEKNPDSDDESTRGSEAVDKDDRDTNAVEEDTFLRRITMDEEGNLYHSNQVDDYLYRDSALSCIHWYDFGRCFKKAKKRSGRTSESSTSSRFRLLFPHPDSDTHELLQIIDPRHKHPSPEHIPRIIGAKIPRKHQNDDVYAFFMLCHFVPFSAKSPLDLGGGIWECYERAMTENNSRVYPRFSARAKEIMRNWDEIHECEDVRDADRLRKRQSTNKKMQRYSKDVLSQLPAEFWDDPASVTAAEKGPQVELDHQTAFTLASFIGANWLTGSPSTGPAPPLSGSQSTVSDIRDPFASLADFKKRWQAQINTAARERAHARRACLDPSKQLMPAHELESQILSADTIQSAFNGQITAEAALIVPTAHGLSPPRSWQEIMEDVEKKFGLNERQTWCFRICADRFQELLAERIRIVAPTDEQASRPASSQPLRFLMTGPGGTGKTYTIAAFQHLMSQFDSAHLIRFLAPTGNTAVNLPNGQTIHKACGISVYDDSEDSGRHALRLTISLEKRGQLRDEWKNVEFLLVDEISLVGAQLLCDLDLILHCVREVDDWFGGINIIFAGDFFQLPPVQATPLYRPILATSRKGPAHARARERHGRIAWKQVDTVIELTEQKRMEDDKEFADAVLRLRLHEALTQEDIALFNSRVVRSLDNPQGVDLANERFRNLIAVVEYNKTRMALNSIKAHHHTSSPGAPKLLTCAARHMVAREDAHEAMQRICLQTYHPKLPGELELYIGAPVVLKVSCQV